MKEKKINGLLAEWMKANFLIAIAKKGGMIHRRSNEAACYGRPNVLSRRTIR